MSRRGVLVDQFYRDKVRAELEADLDKADRRFQNLARAVWGEPYADRNKYPDKRTFSLNYSSPDQLKAFFYEALQLPVRYTFVKGDQKITVNREALEWIDENAQWGGIFARYIIAMRDYRKKISVLKKQLSADGRMRCSYNVAGTETGRWSSSEDPFGNGDNLQNWTKKMRRCVVADPGYRLYSIDYSQAESFVTGGLAYRDGRDKAYLTACRSGDLHTAVTKEVWPDLGWSGDKAEDKAIAEQPFYFALSYRDTTKRLGHGSNYLGSAPHLAKITRTDKDSVFAFQAKYFRRFPGIKRYHAQQIARVQMEHQVETVLGRRRHFFGHPLDAATHRKAIAFDPQSTVGDMLNLALWKVWYELDEWGPSHGPLQLLLQVHDNIVFQLPEILGEDEHIRILARVMELLQIELRFLDEVVTVPADVEYGWNWAPKKVDKSNIDGLDSWRPTGINRTRQFATETVRLDQLAL
jgi:DNA polymerase I-like protein with 3'-5' exonuclease and polymerase domains